MPIASTALTASSKTRTVGLSELANVSCVECGGAGELITCRAHLIEGFEVPTKSPNVETGGLTIGIDPVLHINSCTLTNRVFLGRSEILLSGDHECF